MLKIFSVYDSKVGSYLQPMFFRSKGEAIRAFSSAVADTGHQFNKYAEDFTLFELGTWDEDRAIISSLSTPVSIGVAIEFVNRDSVPVQEVDTRTQSMAV